MRTFSLGGRSVITTAVANQAGGQLWNPSTNRSMYLTAFAWAKTAAVVDNLALLRSSARGATPNNTVTAVLANDLDGDQAPPSGALLDMGAFGTDPTKTATVPGFRWNFPATIGSGVILTLPRPIRIAPGSGLCWVTPTTVALQPADLTVWWDE